MRLSTGARLGPYEIVAAAGAGGMGEVYRARDTRLDRTVALKILGSDARSPELRARFEREARAISSLSHPHICALYDVGSDDGVDYLVMEYLEGESLAQRLERGPLTLSQTLKTGVEIAAALDQAHRAGIVHRDLKPANIILTKSGAKLVDFGLAKSDGIVSPTEATQKMPLTSEGTIVGTFHYMAPEQIEGGRVDSRSDVFALGAVLYEMVTGRRLFEGKTVASVIAAVLEHEAPPLPAGSGTPALDHVVRRCLAKSPEDRWQSARDVANELRWVESTSGAAQQPAGTRARRWGAAAGWIVAALAVAGSAAWMILRQPQPATRQVEFVMRMPDMNYPLTAAVSPDGSRIAWIEGSGTGEKKIHVRTLESANAEELAQTDGAHLLFWGPTVNDIGFFRSGKLWVKSLHGSPQMLCDAPYGVGATWTRDGHIVFTPAYGQPLFRIPVTGGTPVPVTQMDSARKESAHTWPLALADGKILFVVRSIANEQNRIAITTGDGAHRIVTEADALVGYSAPWLLFVRAGVIHAQQFDSDSGTLKGDVHSVISSIVYSEAWSAAAAHVAGDTLIYKPYRAVATQAQRITLDGTATETIFKEPNWTGAALSPDGKAILAEVRDPVRGSDDLWVYRIGEPSGSRITDTISDEDAGTWTADSRSVIYQSDENGPYAALMIGTDGLSAPRKLFGMGRQDVDVEHINAQGKLLFTALSSTGNRDIYVTSAPDWKPALWFSSDFSDEWPRFSPDGNWVVFSVRRSNAGAVFVRRFEGGESFEIAGAGAQTPTWSGDGKTIYYSRGSDLYAVPVTISGTTMTRGAERHVLTRSGVFAMDPLPDGFMLFLRDDPSDEVRVVHGWSRKLPR